MQGCNSQNLINCLRHDYTTYFKRLIFPLFYVQGTFCSPCLAKTKLGVVRFLNLLHFLQWVGLKNDAFFSFSFEALSSNHQRGGRRGRNASRTTSPFAGRKNLNVAASPLQVAEDAPAYR